MKINLKKEMPFGINTRTIHHDPYQWIQPDIYNPERFNFKDPNNKWTKTADDKPRNPLAFTPFLGGKRVCLGKTFAEVTIKFTVPILFHHVDLTFAEPEKQRSQKDCYSVGSLEEPSMPHIVTIKNEVKL